MRFNFITNLRNWWNGGPNGSSLTDQQAFTYVMATNTSMGGISASGVRMTAEGNLTVSAVWQACEIIANPIATMDFPVYKRSKRGKSIDPTNPIFDLLNFRANPEQTSLKLKQTLMLHCLLHGNGYLRIIRDFDSGFPLQLWNIDPNLVHQDRTASGRLYYVVDGKRVSADDIIHISKLAFNGLKGYSLNSIGYEGLSLSKSLELFGATFFGNNCVPGGFIKTDSSAGSPEKLKAYEDEINRDYGGLANTNKIKVLKPGTEWIPNNGIGMGEQSQFTASRQFQLMEVCRYLNLDPARIGAAPVPSDIESYNMTFFQQTIQPWAELIEAEFNSKLFGYLERRLYFCKMDFSTLLRANSNSRADYYTKLYNLGAITTNQIIEIEGLGDDIGPAGDLHFIPSNNLQPLESIHQQLTAPVVNQLPADPVQSVASGPDGASVAALRAVVMESINRMVKREAEAVGRIINKPAEEQPAALEQFYSRHEGVVRDSIGTAVRAFVIISQSTDNAEQLIDEITRELTTESRSKIIASEAVEDLIENWTETKAKEIADLL